MNWKQMLKELEKTKFQPRKQIPQLYLDLDVICINIFMGEGTIRTRPQSCETQLDEFLRFISELFKTNVFVIIYGSDKEACLMSFMSEISYGKMFR